MDKNLVKSVGYIGAEGFVCKQLESYLIKRAKKKQATNEESKNYSITSLTMSYTMFGRGRYSFSALLEYKSP